MAQIRILGMVMLMVSALTSFSQDKDPFEVQRAVMNKALTLNDAGVAKNAIYQMMALKPDYLPVKDTLAMIYFQNGEYPQSIILAEEILSYDPKNRNILHIKAMSERAMGQVRESLSDYEKLFGMTDATEHLYEIASLRYRLKRYGECEASLKELITRDDATEKTVGILVNNQQRQEIPILAAAYNMYGVLKLDFHEEEKAEEFFEKALELSPDFQLASSNLKVLQQKEEDAVMNEEEEKKKKKK